MDFRQETEQGRRRTSLQVRTKGQITLGHEGGRMTETIFRSPLLIYGLLGLAIAVIFYVSWRRNRSGVSGGGPNQSKGATILDITRKLRATNAPWPTIMAQLNPRNDPKATELLLELRGPHMFAPHTALNIIEDACQSTLKARPSASLRDILRNACINMRKVTRYGD